MRALVFAAQPDDMAITVRLEIADGARGGSCFEQGSGERRVHRP
jgi:hypothetical protein